MKFGGLAAAVLVVSAHAEGANDIPLKDCTSQRVMMTLHYDSVQREATSGSPMMANLEKIKALAARYHGKGKPGQPMIEYMSAADAGDFATLSAQLKTMRLNELAESRLQRDMGMLSQMQVLAEKDRTTGLALKEGDPDLKVYTYLYAMRTYLQGNDHPAVKNKSECSLDRAFDTEATAGRLAEGHAKVRSKRNE